MRILVFGTAGSGKSYLISCIRLLFEPNEILVLAPTGVAARLLGAQTECSALYMPIRNKRHTIPEQLLSQFREKYKDILIVIQDERSMKGQIQMS